MRVIILVVAISAALMLSSIVVHAQDAQTAAEIVASGIEISPADCGAGGAARRDWVVVADTTASSGNAMEYIRATTTEAADALAVCHAAALKNGDLSLRFKSSSGASHQAGGLALRMATPTDYYLVKIDVRRNRALLLQVRNGLEEEIVSVDADVAADLWHTLAVRAQDDRFTVYLDGVWIFTGYDKTFPHAGAIGLWAEPGSITRFDRITMGPTPKSPSWQ
ncbi:hypothetical protein SAMN05444159_0074 [Bradyrhizobium lablabi]|uniref:Uncharacterized protein n=1 Tax=Bradyrhizobium lablabi TaxID=722472 RepID=A0A1M6HQS4_9BRAD|nr:hypothetical protein [Bradyrhizobium lablabi]SHJ24506.1 hypothetical protein SAMN05444159_0074 [Bradyrhizobium lablabi]